jgi:hypothetical protein
MIGKNWSDFMNTKIHVRIKMFVGINTTVYEIFLLFYYYISIRKPRACHKQITKLKRYS